MIKKQSSEILYFSGYCLLLIRAFIETTAFVHIVPQIVFTLMRASAYALIAFRIILVKKLELKYAILGVMLIGISIITKLESSYTVLLDFSLCSVGAVQIEFKKIVKTYLYASMCLTAITIIAALAGVIPNYTYLRADTGKIRLSMGFVYTTDFAAHIFFIFAAILYLRFKISNNKDLIFAAVVAYITYMVTDARAACALIIVSCIVCIVGRKRIEKGLKPYPDFIMMFSPILCAIITFLAVRLYNPRNAIWKEIDEISSNRLTIAQQIMKRHKVTLFGQYIAQKGDGNGVLGYTTSTGYTYIDLSYMRILLMYGLVFLAFLLVYCVILNKKALKNGDYVLPIMIVITSCYGLVAQHFFDFAYNFFLLAYFSEGEKSNLIVQDYVFRIFGKKIVFRKTKHSNETQHRQKLHLQHLV